MAFVLKFKPFKSLDFFFWGLSKFFRTNIWVKKYFPFFRHYHGHLSAVYDLALHPTIDVLVSCGRDSTARVWDMRTKTNIHTLSGHTSTVGTVVCQAADPQIITGIEIILFFGRAKIFIQFQRQLLSGMLTLFLFIDHRWRYSRFQIFWAQICSSIGNNFLLFRKLLSI